MRREKVKKTMVKTKVDFYENQKIMLLVCKIEELKNILSIQISKVGINNDKTIELSQKLDELIIKYININN